MIFWPITAPVSVLKAKPIALSRPDAADHMTMFVMMSAVSCSILSEEFRHLAARPTVWRYGSNSCSVAYFGLTTALLPIAAQIMGGMNDRIRQALFDCWKFGWMFMVVSCRSVLRLAVSDADLRRSGSYPDRCQLPSRQFILPIYMMLFAIDSFLQALGWRSGYSGSRFTNGPSRLPSSAMHLSSGVVLVFLASGSASQQR